MSEQKNKIIKFDFNKIYSNISKYKNIGNEIKNNKFLQQLVDATFEENKRALYITRVKIESIDLDSLSFFSVKNLESFIYNQEGKFTIKINKKIDTVNNALPLEKIKEKYQRFIKKTWLSQLELQEIDEDEFIQKINEEINNKYKKIKKISKEAKKNKIETGNWSTYLGWPFAIGRIGDTFIRAPIAYFPIRIEDKINEYRIFHEEKPIKINPQIIKTIYSSNKKYVDNLEIDFDNIEEILKEYHKHGIEFNNQLDELEGIKNIKKDDFKEQYKFQEIKLKNIFYIENRIFKEYVWNDSQSILRKYENFNFPIDNKELFGNDIKKYNNNLFLNIDKNKSNVISNCLENSTVIQGPPGTGKSETITALLSLLASKGKESILVSEKNAALSIVKKRLGNKYGLNSFCLKLNGEGLKKSFFWEKIEKNIQEITQVEIKSKKTLKTNDEEFLKILKENNLFIKEIEDHEIKINDFYDYLHLYERYEKYFEGEINKPLEERYNEYKKNIQKLKDCQEKLNLLEKNKNDVNFTYQKTKEKNNSKYEKYKSEIWFCNKEIRKILKSDFVFLSQKEINLKKISETIDNWEIFNYLSNNNYSPFFNFFEKRKQFKKNSKKIVDLKEFLHKNIQLEIEEIQINKEIQKNLKNNQNETQKIENEILKFKKAKKNIEKIYNINDIKCNEMIKTFNDLSNDKKIAIFKLEKIFLNSYKNNNLSINNKYIKIKSKIKNMYNYNKEVIKNNIIKEIQKKIKKNQKDFQTIRSFSSNSKKKPNPSFILKNFFEIIKNMFPFILSTPNEISSYIPNDSNIFDYGIFDESSQMQIQRSFPSIHRCKKIIVAGDKKQLGPSEIFKSRIDDVFFIEDPSLNADSLLSWAENKYKSVILNQHYRSLSSKLIEYSNINFYDSKLMTIDSPLSINNSIESIEVKGIWDSINRINVDEANEVIKILNKEINNFEKIGIITMNKKQSNYIYDLINKESILYKNINNGKIFVKNIENVQGDEADLIIFSLQYSTNYGENHMIIPNILTENRLNVAITRAKRKMIILKSFNSQELGKGNKKTARNILYKWIKWIEENKTQIKKNILAHNWNNKDKFRSEFEREFIWLIEKEIPNNIKILNNYKISSYEIDIVIFNKETDSFIGLIELDGKSFHSSTEQIERDYQKTIFLEEQGWKIRRISSTEFFRNKRECISENAIWINDLINIKNEINEDSEIIENWEDININDYQQSFIENNEFDKEKILDESNEFDKEKILDEIEKLEIDNKIEDINELHNNEIDDEISFIEKNEFKEVKTFDKNSFEKIDNISKNYDHEYNKIKIKKAHLSRRGKSIVFIHNKQKYYFKIKKINNYRIKNKILSSKKRNYKNLEIEIFKVKNIWKIIDKFNLNNLNEIKSNNKYEKIKINNPWLSKSGNSINFIHNEQFHSFAIENINNSEIKNKILNFDYENLEIEVLDFKFIWKKIEEFKILNI